MAERYIPEHRRTQFKAKSTFKPEELRRRREEQQVEIRKAKREENLAKRRGIGTGENRPGASLGAAPDSDDENPPSETQVSSFAFFHPFFESSHICIFCLFVIFFLGRLCDAAFSLPPPHLFVPRCLFWARIRRPPARASSTRHRRINGGLPALCLPFLAYISVVPSDAQVGC